MSATIESDESNQVDVINIISCVTLFYEKGKSESAFLRKEKFRAQLPWKVASLKGHVETA